MNKSDLVTSLAAELKIPITRSRKFVDAFTELLGDRLQQEDNIVL
nr:HU family DNA-binding protein [Parabacteroides goldsteinii]